jgi:hypothetical protein
MLEAKQKDDIARWILQLARNSPEIFGRGGAWKISAFEEPQVASHNTRVYKVDNVGVHVKFFSRTRGRTNKTYDPKIEMDIEYRTLKEYEKKGFSSGKYQVVRALGASTEMDCALATLYAGGKSLQDIIYETLREGREKADLYMGLELLAGLLRRIHTEMPGSYQIDPPGMFYTYLKSLLYLEEQSALDGYHRRAMKGLVRWFNYKPLFEQKGVTVHGDANPSNFKIDNGIIYAYDMERSRPKHSPAHDLGTMAAELRHQFAYLIKDGAKASHFIEHFLSSYTSDKKELQSIKAILPFYMSQSFFKISMLKFWNPDYKKFLIEEGVRCIEVVPS